ncbi:Hepatic leukemia factor [Collichthys lucidus]|uniref:Hepatic leukemia factor n=1 Tax=Collichthys lucidus TaxID=240159 RepID=A0A4U5VK92_COLLU|nr:Hepatic leukemia factor [Collichthys lucidus]
MKTSVVVFRVVHADHVSHRSICISCYAENQDKDKPLDSDEEPMGVNAGGQGGVGGAPGSGALRPNSQSAFLGPLLWERTLPCDGGLFQLQYMDLEEFLTENGMGMHSNGPSSTSAQIPSQSCCFFNLKLKTKIPASRLEESQINPPGTIKQHKGSNAVTFTVTFVFINTPNEEDPSVEVRVVQNNHTGAALDEALTSDSSRISSVQLPERVRSNQQQQQQLIRWSRCFTDKQMDLWMYRRINRGVASERRWHLTTTPRCLETEASFQREREKRSQVQALQGDCGQSESCCDFCLRGLVRLQRGQAVPQDPSPSSTCPPGPPGPQAGANGSSDIMVNFDPDPADLALSSVPGQEAFDPRRHRFSDEELKPQPMIKKARKMLVPNEQKDEKYWSRRVKNNEAAKRSRDARRLKENQISVRAAFLERENAALRQEVADMRKELGRCRNIINKYESRHGDFFSLAADQIQFVVGYCCLRLVRARRQRYVTDRTRYKLTCSASLMLLEVFIVYFHDENTEARNILQVPDKTFSSLTQSMNSLHPADFFSMATETVPLAAKEEPEEERGDNLSKKQGCIENENLAGIDLKRALVMLYIGLKAAFNNNKTSLILKV